MKSMLLYLVFGFTTLTFSSAFAGPSISGGHKSFPVFSCVKNAQSNEQVGFDIYQSNFSTGDESTDRFEGSYYDYTARPVGDPKLECLKMSPARTSFDGLLWKCYSKDVRTGPLSVDIIKVGTKTIVKYYKRDKIELPGEPNISIECE